MVSYLDGGGTAFFMDEGARLRAYSWRSLYSLGVMETRRASRTSGWTAGDKAGSDGDPVAAGIVEELKGLEVNR